MSDHCPTGPAGRLLLLVLCLAFAGGGLRAEDWTLSVAVVAKVNGEPISKTDIELLAGQYLARAYGPGADADELTTEQKTELAKQAFRTLVRGMLVRQEANSRGVTVPGGEVLEAIRKKGLEPTPLNRRLVHEDLLFDEIQRRFGKPVLDPTPSEVRAYYQRNRDQFRRPRFVRARQIRVPKATGLTRNMERRKAERIHREAQEVGSDEAFVALAVEYAATATDRATGGKLIPPGSASRGGWFAPAEPVMNNIYPEAFVEALRRLPVDTVSDIVETEYGFHILYIPEERPAIALSFREAQRHILAYLKDVQRNRHQREWLMRMIGRSRITWHNDEPIPPSEVLPPEPVFHLSGTPGDARP